MIWLILVLYSIVFAGIMCYVNNNTVELAEKIIKQQNYIRRLESVLEMNGITNVYDDTKE